MTNNDKQREYRIYIRTLGKMVVVSKEVYYEYYRPIWAHRKREQKLGNCTVEHNKDWLCDGDCAGCEFHAYGKVSSIDDIVFNSTSETITYADTLFDESEEPVLDKMCHEELLGCVYDLLAELKGLDQQIAIGIMQGKSEREIAEACGLKNNSSVNWRKKQLLESLRESLAELGFNNY